MCLMGLHPNNVGFNHIAKTGYTIAIFFQINMWNFFQIFWIRSFPSSLQYIVIGLIGGRLGQFFNVVRIQTSLFRTLNQSKKIGNLMCKVRYSNMYVKPTLQDILLKAVAPRFLEFPGKKFFP